MHSIIALKIMRTKSRQPAEQPPANFEEVKRRFIRQNRDLAKANSTQSLRIRSLEIENTRLLDEILRLRERNLWLERERQNAQINTSREAVQRIKGELQAKFAELTGFIENMAELKPESCDEDFLIPRDRLLSPSQRQYKERQPLAELMQDCLMPTITEHKASPRRTLDGEEIRTIRLSDQSSNGSPDPGPPPVARFDCTDVAQTEPPVLKEEPTRAEHDVDSDELARDLSINLEMRRKKRESHGKIGIRRHSILPQSSEDSEDGNGLTILRVGAKRKLADRDSEKPIKPPSQDDFTFSRKPASLPRTGSTRDQNRPQDETSSTDTLEHGKADPPDSPVKPTRRVLSNKSTNVSPRKPPPKVEKPTKIEADRAAPSKVDMDRQRAQPRNRRVSLVPLPPPNIEPPTIAEVLPLAAPAEETVAELPPITPAVADFFSPSVSEDSARQSVDRGDTPPPADLNGASNTTEGGTRPSRRARSAVNYAEPSLLSKMRRPGKEMVDAISGIQDPRRIVPTQGARKSQGIMPSSQPTTTKKEAQNEEKEVAVWQNMQNNADDGNQGLDPGSPLHSRTSKFATIPAPEMDTISAESPLPRPSTTLDRPNAFTAIPSLNLTSQRRRETFVGNISFENAPMPRTNADEAAKRIEEMNLYEFKESSSPSSDKSDKLDDGRGRGAAAGRSRISQRRHSSILKEAPSQTVTTDTATVVRNERAGNRRRSTLL